jgi:hypothetical protein
LVIAGVAHGHHVGTELAPQRFEGLVASLACSCRRSRTGLEREREATERDTPCLRQLRHVLHFLRRFGTQAMVHGCHRHRQRERFCEAHEHVGEHDGVGPPGAAHQDMGAVAKEATALDGRANGGDQRCQRSASRLRRRR